MALTREERKLLHQKSKQPTFGINKPDSREGHDGDIAFRQVSGSGTVQYVKENGDWTAISSSGTMPQSRNTVNPSSSGSGSISIHSGLSGLSIDDHPQYLLIDGTRAMTGDLSLSGGDGALTFTVAGENSIKIPDNQASALIIEEANTAYLTFTTTNSGEKMQFHKELDIDAVSDFGSNAMTNVNIDSGAIDGTTIGANSQAAGDFTAIGAVSAGTIVGTTIDATTDFTIGTLIITDDQIQMTPSDSDTITIAGASNGVLNITTVDNAAAAANINITADGNIAITSANSITLDTAGSDNEVVFSNGGTERFAFKNDGSPEIDVTGNFTIDGSADITIDSVGDTYIKTNSNFVVHVGTTGFIKLHNYDVTLYQNYGIMNKKDKYHFTTGQADLKQNYSILSYFEESTTFETYPS
tara:strand:+ start:4673 stop:5911 length:1239 start_codon:yes stop_codon:yes gene_type:complete